MTARELKWRDYLRAVQQITALAVELFGGGVNRERIGAASSSLEDLCGWLFSVATDLPKDIIPDLRTDEGLTLLAKILEVNPGPEFIQQGSRAPRREQPASSEDAILKTVDRLVSAGGYSLADIDQMTVRQLRATINVVTDRIRTENTMRQAAMQQARGRRR